MNKWDAVFDSLPQSVKRRDMNADQTPFDYTCTLSETSLYLLRSALLTLATFFVAESF